MVCPGEVDLDWADLDWADLGLNDLELIDLGGVAPDLAYLGSVGLGSVAPG